MDGFEKRMDMADRLATIESRVSVLEARK
jgi:hypothetical protein